MSKVLNAAFGVVIAIVTMLVVILGIHVFYPEPQYPESKPCNFDKNETAQTECFDEQNAVYQAHEKVRETYNGNYFIIANIMALVLIGASFATRKMLNIMLGLLFAALGVILNAFATGWTATTDVTKFLVALVVLGIIIAFALYVRNLGEEKKEHRNK